LLGRWHSGCDLLIVISGDWHRSGNCSGYEHCPDCPCDSRDILPYTLALPCPLAGAMG
jgi:hypothetical protein